MIVLFVRFTPGKDDERRDLLEAHHAYLEENYASGRFLASGPADSGDGVILIKGDDADAMAELASNDPFVRAGIARYDPIHVRVTRASRDSIAIEVGEAGAAAAAGEV